MSWRRPDPAVLRLLVFLGALLAVLVVLISLRRVVMPLLVGLAVAYVLNPLVEWFERHGRSRLFGVVVIALVLILLVGAVLFGLIPLLGNQLQQLTARIPEYSETLGEWLMPWYERLESRYPEQMEELRQRARAFFEANLPRLAGSVGKRLGALFGTLYGFVLFLLSLVFVPVFAFYLLVDLPKLRRGVVDLIPLPYRETALSRFGEVDAALSSFLRGQLTIALVLAAINGLGLMLLGVPFGLGIGLMAGLANMIPYMAPVVGLAPALLLSWAEHQSWLRLLGVAGVFAGAQMLEGTVLSPRILSRSVKLHPVWVLLSVIVGGSLFGFIGMLLAVPTTAVVQVFVRHWLAAYKQSGIYRGEVIEAGSELAAEGDDV